MLNSSQVFSKSFEQLSKKELYQILALRLEVFCVEQDCPYQDIDGIDFKCQHFFIEDNYQVVAYARVILDEGNKCYIGRIVVKQSFRGQKLATKMIKACLNFCQKTYPKSQIEISAQSYLKEYYQSLGFKSAGKFYLEDDIPHEIMQINPI